MTDNTRALLEQALAFMVRAEMMYGQPNQAVQAALRAELAKPEQEESFIPNLANYRQGVADGKADSPKWHDAPTKPGLWFNSINHYAELVSQHWIDRGVVANSHARWYGPIQPDGEKS